MLDRFHVIPFAPRVQVGYSQSLSPVSRPDGHAQVPRPLQAFCGLLPVQRGKIVMRGGGGFTGLRFARVDLSLAAAAQS